MLKNLSDCNLKENELRVSNMDIIRVNIWQKKVYLSNIENDEEEEAFQFNTKNKTIVKNNLENQIEENFTNFLRVLNLSGNKLKQVPNCLACCCPRLCRLDLSKNYISYIGVVKNLPNSLKHLNLSHNKLTKCFQNTNEDLLSFVCCAASLSNYNDTEMSSNIIKNNYLINRHSRSRSKSVARNQRSLSVIRDSSDKNLNYSKNYGVELCIHKSHSKFEALKTLILSHNFLTSIELFALFETKNIATEQFNWKEDGQQMRAYLLFPSLTTLDVSNNQLKNVPSTISLLSNLSIFNISSNLELETLPPELGLLDKLWNIGLKNCSLKEPLKSIVNQENYKTMEILSVLRNQLEDSKHYPKLKLMLLGGPEVGKTTLLKKMKLEGYFSRKSHQSESWALRMGHAPKKILLANTSFPINFFDRLTIDIAEWNYKPKKSSNFGPIAFRTWDFTGFPKKLSALKQYFFTRRCVYLLVWKVTEGEIIFNELHEWLLLIQIRAPNATVIIVGTHLDLIKENASKFPLNYLNEMDKIIQDRFVNVTEADKKGLPCVLASIYISSKSKENVRYLCNLIYQIATEIRVANRQNKLLTEKIPASFVALEKIVVSITDEMRIKGEIPILSFNDFWIFSSTQIVEEYGRSFRDIQEFQNACYFLHENGVIVYYDDTLIRDYVFFDPPWLCTVLCTALLNENTVINYFNKNSLQNRQRVSFLMHEYPIIEFQKLNSILKLALCQFIGITNTSSDKKLEVDVEKKISLLTSCLCKLFNKFELALPFLNKWLLLPLLLPDEYLLRADYPGAKIQIYTNEWNLQYSHFLFYPQENSIVLENNNKSTTLHESSNKNYITQKNLIKDCIKKCDNVEESLNNLNNSQNISNVLTKFSTDNTEKLKKNTINENNKIKQFSIKKISNNNLRRIYVMQYIPPGFWPRLITRILDDDKLCKTFSTIFIVKEILPKNTTTKNNKSNDSNDNKNLKLNENLMEELNTMFNYFSKEKKTLEETDLKMDENLSENQKNLNLLNSRNSNFYKSNSTEILNLKSSNLSNLKKDPVNDNINEKKFDYVNKYGFMWILWKTGMEITSFGTYLFSLKQFLPLANLLDLNYSLLDLQKRSNDGSWKNYKCGNNSFIIEILIPYLSLNIELENEIYKIEMDYIIAAKFLSLVTNIIDDLLEDWFPALGTRYVHTSKGHLLVDRLIPCYHCAETIIKTNKNQIYCNKSTDSKQNLTLYLFSFEECILNAINYHKKNFLNISNNKINESLLSNLQQKKNKEFFEKRSLKCPLHLDKQLLIKLLAPDVLFIDITDCIISPENIKQGKLVGQGSFGFVFNGFIKKKNDLFIEVALKVLEPLDINLNNLKLSNNSLLNQQEILSNVKFYNENTTKVKFQPFCSKWNDETLENMARAYYTARQELNMLYEIKHAHITALIGFSVCPMTLIVELASFGSLNIILAKYRKNNVRLHFNVLQQTTVQVAKALEYLHLNHIIYRDLKSENILVWRFPSPHALPYKNSFKFSNKLPNLLDVYVKLGDYGISRFSYPSGVCKGYGGTENFMAPEIIRFNGEKEYTEKVDCYSFGMFIYELITLKQPYEGREQMKDFILEGRRPYVSEKELLYPNCLLDLMVTCWSESAHDRPNSSQLVGICSAPEFTHLLDVALLTQNEMDYKNDIECFESVSGIYCQESNGFYAECEMQYWLTTNKNQNKKNNVNINENTGSIIILTANQFGWIEKKIISGNSLPAVKNITIFSQVNENIWIGDKLGNVYIYCPHTFLCLHSFSIKQSILNSKNYKHKTKIENNDNNTKELSICSIKSYPEKCLVILAIKYCVLIYRISSNFYNSSLTQHNLNSQNKEKNFFSCELLTTIHLSKIHKILDLIILRSFEDWQIWTSHSNAKIIIHYINGVNNQLMFSTSINHFNLTNSTELNEKKIQNAENDVFSIIPSQTISFLVWSTLKEDSRIFQWQNANVQKTLNCSKILPISESLSSMNLEVMHNSFITSINLITPQLADFSLFKNEYSNEEKLIVGTNHGVVLIVQAKQMLPLTSFRPFSSTIKHILVYNTNNNYFCNINSENTIQNFFENNTEVLNSEIKQPNNLNISNIGLKKQDNFMKNEGFFITIGEDYRCLLNRFLNSSVKLETNYFNEDFSNTNCSKRDKNYALCWRSDDWIFK